MPEHRLGPVLPVESQRRGHESCRTHTDTLAEPSGAQTAGDREESGKEEAGTSDLPVSGKEPFLTFDILLANVFTGQETFL